MSIWVGPVGVLIGLALGALGGGGSILTVPALVYLLGQAPATATSGSLVIVGVSAAVAMISHLRLGRVDVGTGLTFGALGVVGTYAGSRLSAQLPGAWLLTAFGVLLLVVAALMERRARRPAGTPSAAALVAQPPAVEAGIEPDSADVALGHRARWPRVVLAATGVGLLTGFFGVGGGFAIVPALVLTLGFSMPRAVGTSLLVITVNSATAFASRLTVQVDLDWTVIGVFTALVMAGSLLGAQAAHRLDPRLLGRAFTLLLAAVALYTLARSLPGLLPA